ncbi:hypothetical protein ACS0TY_017281 [Phlomoides rotata]
MKEIFFAIFTLFSCLPSVASQLPCDHYPNTTANLSTNNDKSFSDIYHDPTFSVRAILRRGSTSGVEENSVIWQSFDHPTDFLLPRQILKPGMNLTENGGPYSVSMTEEGSVASILSDAPEVYCQNFPYVENRNKEVSYALFKYGCLVSSIRKTEYTSPNRYIRRRVSLSKSVSIKVPIAPTILGVIFVGIIIRIVVFVYQRMRGRSEEDEEDYLDHVPGMPTRFSLEELAVATDNFNNKLGEGGFGSVFQGSFNDGTIIAVKRLDGVRHIKKSFQAEVQSIGSIHHINLVRLIGFCAEKSHRLLVYAYMCNGSLERWIYCKIHDKMLEWNCRRNIILDIAKGLTYLHEECLQKIIHLDIKPQNILLDERFNAKLGDFGLSKLIDRDQSNVVTTMRGTPGYLAPEWLKSAITEKVDVYSFGVVILEIVCGRKIFEQSRPEEERHLPTHFMKKAEEGLWLDLVDNCCLDVESNVEEIEETMQIAARCLQSDPEKRPSMSMVIKILEGVNNVPKDMDYNIFISQITEVNSQDATRQLPSLLSGPR